MPSHIYNVKQAAKILGLSTNTTYKYLNEGRIKAARGHVRGTFIITKRSLETFLGTKLPDDPLLEVDPQHIIPDLSKSEDAYVEIAPPNLTVQIARVILTLCLILLIIDQIFLGKIPLIHTANNIFLYLLFFLLLYQYGGFTKQ